MASWAQYLSRRQSGRTRTSDFPDCQSGHSEPTELCAAMYHTFNCGPRLPGLDKAFCCKSGFFVRKFFCVHDLPVFGLSREPFVIGQVFVQPLLRGLFGVSNVIFVEVCRIQDIKGGHDAGFEMLQKKRPPVGGLVGTEGLEPPTCCL